MEVREIMSEPVVTIGPEATLRAAVETMLEARVGSVVVVDGRPAVGIVTRTDVLRATLEAQRPFGERPVHEVMTDDVVMTTGTTSVTAALRTMTDHRISRLPVRQGRKPVGVVTLTDVARHLPAHLEEVRAVARQKDRHLD